MTATDLYLLSPSRRSGAVKRCSASVRVLGPPTGASMMLRSRMGSYVLDSWPQLRQRTWGPGGNRVRLREEGGGALSLLSIPIDYHDAHHTNIIHEDMVADDECE